MRNRNSIRANRSSCASCLRKSSRQATRAFPIPGRPERGWARPYSPSLAGLPLGLERLQHALQREVPIALQRKRCDLGPIAMLAHVERHPAAVAEIRRDAKAWIGAQETLLSRAHPKAR